MKQEEIIVPFNSMPRLINGSFLTKEQEKKLKEPFKDLVRVVRCRDCKHILPKGFCHKHSRKVTDDFFCADGERKIGER